jgi:serine/threonine-protein kinase
VEQFGKFELLREIGRGGMGVVYLARQQDLGRTVAVKMILSSRLASADDVRRFYAEARTAAGLRHPNIIGIHEVGELHGQHFFVMDFVEGENLKEVISRRALDAETAARTIAAVARAVDYLHGHKIVHRDLKPSNIIVDEQGTPYVTDFGLAKLLDAGGDATRSGTIIGTPSYMPPEQAAGHNSEVSARSDVYSLGAILYELLTGRPPFEHAHPLDTLVDVLEGEPTLPTRLNPGAPRALEQVTLRCLEKDPADRYPSAAALADDLERYLRGEPVEAQPIGLWQRAQRWMRREPALASRLVGLGVAAGIVQGYYLVSGWDFSFHVEVMSVFASWALASFAFQQLLPQERFAGVVRFAWIAADAIALTTLLFMADPHVGPLLIGYALLVVASGLFFRVGLVWFTTFVCLVSYATLLFVRSLLRGETAQPWHYPVIFAGGLAVLGFMVAYQVHRVRALSRYYEHRPLP